MKNKSFKRVLAAVLVATNVMTAGAVAMPVTSQAAVFKNDQEMAESLVFGQNYSGIFAKDIGDEDDFVLNVPTGGEFRFSWWTTKAIDYQITDASGDKAYISGKASGDVGTADASFRLEKGTYLLRITSDTPMSSDSNGNILRYDFTCDSNFDFQSPSASVKTSSPANGTMKVYASKEKGSITGFEVRYKKQGTKKWTVKMFKGDKALNQKIKGLKSGTTYTVETRKYVKDADGHFYYSDWTANNGVKIR